MRGNRGLEVIEVMIIVGIVSIFAVIVSLGYVSLTSEKIVLQKSAWTCTKTEIRETMQAMPLGKGVMMMPIPETVCVEYKMKGE